MTPKLIYLNKRKRA